MDVSLLGWREALDIGLTALLLFLLLTCVRTARSVLMLLGLGVVAASYAVTKAFGYALSSEVLLILLVTGCAYAVFISHDDMRRWLERAAGLARQRNVTARRETVDVLVQAAQRMADAYIGALIVLPGAQPLGHDVHGGVELDAKLSVPILLSLFDPSSPGHDGALIVRSQRASEFAVHLPLSTNKAALGEHGTRHAAALGLSERTDALCLVISEERGQISIAHGGEIRPTTAGELSHRLQTHLDGNGTRQTTTPPMRWRRHLLHAVLALSAATVGWVATIQGGQDVTRTFAVPVELQGLPEGYTLERTEPPTVDVTVSGPRNELLLLSDRDIDLGIDGWSVKNGRRQFFIKARNVRAGADLDVRAVEPRLVRVHVSTPESLVERPQ